MKYTDQRGVTLIELVITTGIASILIGTVSTFFLAQLLNVSRANALTNLQSNTKQAIEVVAKDVRSARTIEAINSLSDANGPGGNAYGWASTTGSPSTLVISIPAQDASANLLYVDSNHNTLYTNDVIYYILNPGTNQAALYRRIIANSVAGNIAVTSCPPPGAGACPSDAKIVENIADLAVTYYDTNNAITTLPANSYSLELSLSEFTYIFGRKVTSTINSRISLRNKP